jgi:hypothetical protein
MAGVVNKSNCPRIDTPPARASPVAPTYCFTSVSSSWQLEQHQSITYIMSAPAEFLDFIDKNADKFIQRLADAVAIPRSVSDDQSDPADLQVERSFYIAV